MARISNVMKNEAQLLITGTNTPLTFEFISWICIGYGKLLLITEADALKARLDGIKGQRGRVRLAPLLVALAHFHYHPLTKTCIALCANNLNAPLFYGLLNTFSVLEMSSWPKYGRKPSIKLIKSWALMMTALGVGLMERKNMGKTLRQGECVVIIQIFTHIKVEL